jgi:hypothetical protein
MKVIQIDRKIELVTLNETWNRDTSESVFFFDRGQHQVGDEPHPRGYYLTAEPIRLVLVLRNGVRIEQLSPGAYVEVKVGTDTGEGRPTNLYRGETHRKVSVFRVLPGPPNGGDVASFGDIVDTAPPEKRYRGGRPSLTPGENVLRSNVSLPASMWDMLAELGGGNKSAGIRRLAELTEPPSTAVTGQIVDSVCRVLKVTPTKVQYLLAVRAIQEALDARNRSQRGD